MANGSGFYKLEGSGTGVSDANPLPVTMALAQGSGVTPAIATLNAISDGNQTSFAPVLGRPFNATARRSIDFAGSYQLERKFPGDANWYVVLGYADLIDLPETFQLTETEAGVTYRWNMTARTAGSVAVRISA